MLDHTVTAPRGATGPSPRPDELPAGGARRDVGPTGRRPAASGRVVGALALALAATAAAPAWAGSTERVSVGPGGVQGNDTSGGLFSAVSADGRFVAFESEASNLVPTDTNDAKDIFVRDRRAGTTRRVSVGPGGAQANNGSFGPSISADGRFVAFASDASNLVAGDTNRSTDVFVRDLQTGTTVRASVGPRGAEADRPSFQGVLSADGRFVVFASPATNLVAGDTNNATDVVVRDLSAGTNQLASAGPGGVQGDGNSDDDVAVSADGRFVAFASAASNLVRGDTNGAIDVFVRDRRAGTTRRVSVGVGGAQANDRSLHPSISADGRFVAFDSDGSNVVTKDTNGFTDVFVRDVKEATTTRVSVGFRAARPDGASSNPAISADGRRIAFASGAANLIAGDTNKRPDVFLRDLRAGTTLRVSVGKGGRQANGISYSAALSPDGRAVAFASTSSNLVPNDTNGRTDVFVHAELTP